MIWAKPFRWPLAGQLWSTNAAREAEGEASGKAHRAPDLSRMAWEGRRPGAGVGVHAAPRLAQPLQSPAQRLSRRPRRLAWTTTMPRMRRRCGVSGDDIRPHGAQAVRGSGVRCFTLASNVKPAAGGFSSLFEAARATLGHVRRVRRGSVLLVWTCSEAA